MHNVTVSVLNVFEQYVYSLSLIYRLKWDRD